MVRIGSLWSRPTLYYNIDGVGELGMGFFLLGYALLFWVQAHTPQDSIWHKTSMIYFGAMIAIIHFGSKAIKKHITYARTGYVEYRRRDRLWAAAVSAIATLLILIAAARFHWHLAFAVRLIGLPFAAAYALSLARMFPWKWAVVPLMLASSLAIALRIPDLGDALLLNCAVYGTLMLASGAITFWLYLRRTQPPTPEAQ